MWAISEFEADNGATRLIPRSHLWDDQQKPEESQTLVAGMRPGSVLFWEGATYHGAGASYSSQPRVGALMGYSLGWLRQYENQYLAVPPDVARTLSPQLQQLLGYQSHGYLGSYEGVDPRALLQEPDLELPAPADLLTADLEGLSRQRH
jgi:ectoine hydroxylase-related dioxygenase (phytanoyl-CoA dioxygenase family)